MSALMPLRVVWLVKMPNRDFAPNACMCVGCLREGGNTQVPSNPTAAVDPRGAKLSIVPGYGWYEAGSSGDFSSEGSRY